MFGYVFSPWASYDPFWGYGPIDLWAGIFWPYGGQAYADDWYGGYADYGLPFDDAELYGSGRRHARVAHVQRHPKMEASNAGPEVPAEAAQMCAGQAESLTGLPIDDIERAVTPTGDLRAGLDELKAASIKANQELAASCPSQVPLTPPARLAAMQKRLEAMRQAVETIRGPLEKFYASLNDEQKTRLDAMRVDTGPQPKGRHRRGQAAFASWLDICHAQQPDASAFPHQQIESTVQPTEAQRINLANLNAAAVTAADLVKDTCPTEMPTTVTGRLAAVDARLGALLQAVEVERPALQKFYDSLSDEQKAAFNAMQPPQAQTTHRG
jgi:hypothetical protein